MTDYTVKADVDTMLRANDKAAIRSAIGVGTTDAPTFLAVNIGVNSFLTESGELANTRYGTTYWRSSEPVPILLRGTGALGWSSGTSQPLPSGDTFLYRDGAPGILAQRNGSSPQAFRVANQVGASPLVDYDRGVFDFKTTTNTLRIGTENGGTYTTARPIDFVTGGVVRMSIGIGGYNTITGALVVSTYIHAGQSSAFGWDGRCQMTASAVGVIRFSDWAGTNFNRLQLGGTTSAFPAIKRNGTGIDIRLADDTGFAPLRAGSVNVEAGTAAAPSLTFGDSGTGLWRHTVDRVGISAAGTNIVVVYSSGMYMASGAFGVGTSNWLRIGTTGFEVTTTAGGGTLTDLKMRNVIQSPGVGTTVTPANNSELVFETTSNTSVTLKLKGTDGTVRSVALTLA